MNVNILDGEMKLKYWKLSKKKALIWFNFMVLNIGQIELVR